jgi:predicted nucleic acid-binding protein
VSKQPLVCDTTIPLYLGRIGQIDLLPALFAPVYIPEQVCLELDMGRVLRADTVNPRSLVWAELVSVSQVLIDSLPPNRLGTGERAVIAYAQANRGYVAGMDDSRARQLAEAIGLKVTGTLGILLRAKQAGLISTVRPLVDDITAQGFHLSPELHRDVLELAGETP